MADKKTKGIMKQQIEATLQCLLGTSFWGAGRISTLLTFQFGVRQLRTNHGKLHEVGTYALHVQCTWRLAQAQHILAASGDRAYEPDDEHEQVIRSEMEPYAWPQTETRLLDQRLSSFFQQCEKTPIFVQAIQADDLGGLTLILSDNHTFTVFPDDSLDEEYWRFFEPGKELPHFVVTGQGIEDQDA
jgi:hypothetical protein